MADQVTAPTTTAELACVDGRTMPAQEATIPATDEGLLRGDGAFEVIRVYDGRAVRAARPPRPAGAFGGEPSARRCAAKRAGERDPGAAGGARRQRLRRLAADRAHPRRPPPAAHGAAATHAGAGAPRCGRLRAHAGARRHQVALVRRQHAVRPARARARLRRGAARDPARARARGAHLDALLGRPDRHDQHAAAQRAHPRLDHPRSRDEGGRRDRAALHHGRSARGERGLPGVDPARGAVDSRRSRTSSCPRESARARPGEALRARIQEELAAG